MGSNEPAIWSRSASRISSLAGLLADSIFRSLAFASAIALALGSHYARESSGAESSSKLTLPLTRLEWVRIGLLIRRGAGRRRAAMSRVGGQMSARSLRWAGTRVASPKSAVGRNLVESQF